MTWTAPEVELPEFSLTAAERPLLEGYLDWHRALLRHKCAGLTGEQLATASVPPSNLTLLGLVRHMAKVERRWFRERIAGQDLAPMYDAGLGVDADFEDVDPERAEVDYARWLPGVRYKPPEKQPQRELPGLERTMPQKTRPEPGWER